MKKAAAIVGVLAVLLVGSVWAYSKFKSPRVLRMPTPEQLAKAFPADTKDIFDNSEKFILLSLDPVSTGNDEFLGFNVIGQTELTDTQAQEEIRRAFYDGLRDTDHRTPCFDPRHGLRAIKNGKTLDFVICFSCHHLEILVNGKETSSTHIGKEPQETFDRVLTEAGVALNPK